MKCAKCGKPIDQDGALFCPYCGKKLSEANRVSGVSNACFVTITGSYGAEIIAKELAEMNDASKIARFLTSPREVPVWNIVVRYHDKRGKNHRIATSRASQKFLRNLVDEMYNHSSEEFGLIDVMCSRSILTKTTKKDDIGKTVFLSEDECISKIRTVWDGKISKVSQVGRHIYADK